MQLRIEQARLSSCMLFAAAVEFPPPTPLLERSHFSDKALAAILERFRCVTVLDSSSISFRASMKEQFPGCGGSHGGGGRPW
jgi:uncharacterized membrane protein YgcG